MAAGRSAGIAVVLHLGRQSLKFDVESLEFPDQPVGSWPIDSSASPLTVTFQHLATPHNSQHTWNTGSCKTQQFQCNTEEFWTAPKPDDCPAPSRVKRYIVNIVISQTEKISYEDGQHQKHLRDLQESLSVLESKLEHNQIEPLSVILGCTDAAATVQLLAVPHSTYSRRDVLTEERNKLGRTHRREGEKGREEEGSSDSGK